MVARAVRGPVWMAPESWPLVLATSVLGVGLAALRAADDAKVLAGGYTMSGLIEASKRQGWEMLPAPDGKHLELARAMFGNIRMADGVLLIANDLRTPITEDLIDEAKGRHRKLWLTADPDDPDPIARWLTTAAKNQRPLRSVAVVGMVPCQWDERLRRMLAQAFGAWAAAHRAGGS